MGLLLFLRLFSLHAADDFDLFATLRKVENRYNSVQTVQVDFQQTLSYVTQPTARRMESGVLFLRKPGKMRWEYKEPTKKLFVSDGKDIFFYTPATNRVEKSKVKETDDMRAPLAFLIGKLDFQRDFKEYIVRPETGWHWIIAKPKSDKAPYREVQFLLTSNLVIARLKVMGQDQSVMEFSFQNERLNPPLDDGIFQFRIPEGAEVVEAKQD
ncbi:MAG: outer membrane lipoprotein chaperone LolA [Candidatus Solibacter usitatus]|nr:outer membrane lipoprotein chaperone LolA [Candidatus Solibacter usitatus]